MSHLSAQLVIPGKIDSSFENVTVLPDELSKYDKPEQGKHMLRYYIQKSTLITGPLLVFGSLTGNTALYQAGLTGDMGSAMAVAGGAYIFGAAGFVATLLGLSSLFHGDRCFTPFRPTNNFLKLRESERIKAIEPFDSWDRVFEKNTTKVIEDTK